MTSFFFYSLVTPYSKLDLKVLSSNSIRTDSIIGRVTVDLYPLLEKENGKCKCIYFLFNVGEKNCCIMSVFMGSFLLLLMCGRKEHFKIIFLHTHFYHLTIEEA